MSASLTVDCDTDNYNEIVAVAAVSLVVVPVLMIGTMLTFVTPVAAYVEARTHRTGVSPLIDFYIAKWKPTHWHFALVDLVTK